MRAAGPSEKNVRELTFEQNEGAQMSNKLESDSAMVTNLERFGVDGVGYESYDETETEPPSSTNPQ
jgi:hypothetical protein